MGEPEKTLCATPAELNVQPVEAPGIAPQWVAVSPMLQLQFDPGSIPAASTWATRAATVGAVAGAVATAVGIAAGEVTTGAAVGTVAVGTVAVDTVGAAKVVVVVVVVGWACSGSTE